MHKALCLFGLLLFACLVTQAQQAGKAGLEKQRAAIQKDLDKAKFSLDETRRNKKTSLAQLNAVQQKLELRQKEIKVINQQMIIINGDINDGRKDIAKLKQELDTLKQQYDRSIIYSYKTRSNYDLLNFIFSANSFNDALKRISYLKSFRAYREEQALVIAHTQDLLHDKITNLNENRSQRNIVLKEEDNARKKLEDEKREKDEVLNKLRLREKTLSKEIADKKRQDLKISSAITMAISKARAADAAEVKKKVVIVASVKTEAAPLRNRTTGSVEKLPVRVQAKFLPLEPNAATKKLSDYFKRNISSLPWPVDAGTISMHYGLQKIPGSDITYFNKFLTFATEAGKSVKVVFDGEVSMITNIGNVQAIIVRHGKYFTTYSNLSSVNVTQGQHVKTGQLLGKVAGKEDNIGEFEFGISDETNTSFDPQKWLR